MVAGRILRGAAVSITSRGIFSKHSVTMKKLKELSNDDIDKMCGDDRGYGGCFSKDELPKVLGRKYYILNMQDSNDGGGTHWVLLDNRRPKEVDYVDSMGQVPPIIVKRLMRSTGKKQVINKFQIQAMGSVVCGWYAVMFAKALGMGNSMAEIIANFDMNNPKVNDKRLTEMFN